jgi:two-component system response regulator AtoC
LPRIAVADRLSGLPEHHAPPNLPSRSSEPPELELVVFWRDEIQVHPLPKQGRISVGRSENNDVRVEHPSVSRRHAELTIGPRLAIEDLGSANGSFVRERIQPENLQQTHGMRRLRSTSAEFSVGESVLLGEVSAVVRRVVQPPSQFGDLRTESSPAPGVIIHDREVREVYAQAERAAKAAISVLILGETGVGKDLLARAMHVRSPRASGPFMSINCAALSETLLESEIFGYERGAFTGAVQARAGLLEAAHGGTVFLDEIGELSASTQAKLLRVLEERAVLRLGARKPRPIDVRFLAATNRDLEGDAQAGRFRSDLFFRIAGLSLTLPPLRARPDDIEPLAQSFLASAVRQLDRRGELELSREALALLRAHAWPGNVRELKNAVERAVILCSERVIRPEHLPPGVRTPRGSSPHQPAPTPGQPVPASPSSPPPLERAGWQAELKTLERSRLVEALERCSGNQTRAAKLLGISRRTLVSRLSEFGIARPRRPSTD